MSEEYEPCESCSQKLGAYILCASCLHNRDTIRRLERELEKSKAQIDRLRYASSLVFDYLSEKR